MPVGIEIKESAASLEETTIEQIDFKKSLSISNCRGQGYDGARVMSDAAYSGVQA